MIHSIRKPTIITNQNPVEIFIKVPSVTILTDFDLLKLNFGLPTMYGCKTNYS